MKRKWVKFGTAAIAVVALAWSASIGFAQQSSGSGTSGAGTGSNVSGEGAGSGNVGAGNVGTGNVGTRAAPAGNPAAATQQGATGAPNANTQQQAANNLLNERSTPNANRPFGGQPAS